MALQILARLVTYHRFRLHAKTDLCAIALGMLVLLVPTCLEVLTKAGQAPSRVPNSPAKRENIGSQSRFCWQFLEGAMLRVTFDRERRVLTLHDHLGTGWLVDGVACIQLVDGESLRTDDPRFVVSQAGDPQSGLVLQFHDRQGLADLRWEVSPLDDRSATVRLAIRNRSPNGLCLERLDVLSGRVASEHDPDRRHVLLNGFVLSPPHPTTQRDENVTSLSSHETVAIESPPLAAGWLTGKHNFGHIDLKILNDSPSYSPGASATTANCPAEPVGRATCSSSARTPSAGRDGAIRFAGRRDQPGQDLAAANRLVYLVCRLAAEADGRVSRRDGARHRADDSGDQAAFRQPRRNDDADLRRLHRLRRLAEQDEDDSARLRPSGTADRRRRV